MLAIAGPLGGDGRRWQGRSPPPGVPRRSSPRPSSEEQLSQLFSERRKRSADHLFRRPRVPDGQRCVNPQITGACCFSGGNNGDNCSTFAQRITAGAAVRWARKKTAAPGGAVRGAPGCRGGGLPGRCGARSERSLLSRHPIWRRVRRYFRIFFRSAITASTFRSLASVTAWLAFTPRSLASTTVTSALGLMP